MSNTLTAVAPVLYAAARIVPRELTGMLAAVSLDFDDKGVAKGDSVKVPIVPALSTSNVTAAQTFTAGSDRTPTTATLTLNNFKQVSWNLTAEEDRSLLNAGNAQDILKQTVEQGFRALLNGVESSVWSTARAGASRAYGTAATTPFASDLSALTNARKILVDNGAPTMDLQSVLDTAAGLNIRNLTQLQKVNESGDGTVLRDGSIGNLFGFKVRESGQITTTTKGTGASYTSDTTGYAVGSTSIAIITGTGTVLAGDFVTFAGDTNKYMVKTGVAAPGTIVLQEPGLKVALAASAVAMTVGGTATGNLAFDRNAIKSVIRPALQPQGAIAEQMVITDEQTGLSVLMLRAPGDSMVSWYMRVVYDSFVPNPYAVAQILG